MPTQPTAPEPQPFEIGMNALLRIDPDLLGVEVVEENLEGGDEPFPHVYAPIPVEAVTAVEPVRRVHGVWRLP